MLDKSKIKKILVISLSNVGDIVLTFPVIDILRRDFPDARIDVIVGPRGESFVKNNPNLGRIFLYHKNQPPLHMIKWMMELGRQRYDLAVDLRNTAIPYLALVKQSTWPMLIRPKGLHMKQQHLARLKSVHCFTEESQQHFALYISDDDRKFVDAQLSVKKKIIVIAPGSRAENKKWREDGFAKLADYLCEHYDADVVFVGDENDVRGVGRILRMMKQSAHDLTGKLSLPQLGYVMSLSQLCVANDSAPLHLASYLKIPVAAFFGPTDPQKYGPWSKKSIVIQKNESCRACQGDKNQLHNCLETVQFEDVLRVLEPALAEIFHVR
ncbi:MAG: glycosyltransferase family 9 protein [Candidatus Omnitrophica bacterium]|nr:glycosyltransferase family 9 protein [Candidatus Omnitrophota bacterium]